MIHMKLWFREDEQRPLVTDLSWAVSNFKEKYERNPTKLYVCKLETDLFLGNHHNLEVIEHKDIDPWWFGLW
jgi:hypothetical protein